MRNLFHVLIAGVMTMHMGTVAAQQVCHEYVATLYNKTGRGADAATACGGLSGATWSLGAGGTATVTSVTGDASGQCTYHYSASDPSYAGSGVVNAQQVQVPCLIDDCPADAAGAPPVVKNATVCYSRDGQVDSQWECVGPPNQLPPGTTLCDGQCNLRVGNAVSAWVSSNPTSQGLYRRSLDMEMTRPGGSCTALDPAMNPNAVAAPPCTGYVGTVNGKPYCAGTAQTPVANDVPVKPPIPPTEGNPTAGSTPTPGTDRTPAAGGGGPEGGPRGGGTVILPGGGGAGPGPSGTVTKPADGTEQAECGAPGQPKCAIDETGTPTKADGTGSFTNAGKAVDDSEKGFKDALASIKDQPKPEWTWSFQLPTACSTFYLDEFDITIDMCQWQPTIHDLMAIVWIGATIWFGIAIVGKTLGGGR